MEFQGVGRDGYFESAVDGGDSANLLSRYAHVHIPYGGALFVYDSTFNGKEFLSINECREKQGGKKQEFSHRSFCPWIWQRVCRSRK